MQFELAESVEGYVRAADIARDRVEDASTELSVGDKIEARFMGVDRKNRTLSLSIKAKDEAEEKEAVESVNKQQGSSDINSAMANAFKAAKLTTKTVFSRNKQLYQEVSYDKIRAN